MTVRPGNIVKFNQDASYKQDVMRDLVHENHLFYVTDVYDDKVKAYLLTSKTGRERLRPGDYVKVRSGNREALVELNAWGEVPINKIYKVMPFQIYEDDLEEVLSAIQSYDKPQTTICERGKFMDDLSKVIEGLERECSEDYRPYTYISDVDLTDNASDADIDLFEKQVNGIRRALKCSRDDLLAFVDDWFMYNPKDYDCQKIGESKNYSIWKYGDVVFGYTELGSRYPWLWFKSEDDADKYLRYVEDELGYE